MSFFYDLNKKLDAIRQTPSKTHGQLNERDMGKHNNATTGFKAVADKAAKEYGSKAAGERVAGAVKAKMAKAGKLEEEGMSRAAKGYEKYGREGMEALAKAGREGKALDPIRKKYDKYDEGQDFGPGTAGPKRNQAGPSAISPDYKNYKTPNTDRNTATKQSLDKMAGQGYSDKNFPTAGIGAWDKDAQGQEKYVNRTAPGVINKIKDKLGYDMPDPAYGPRPDERERLAKRYPKPTQESGGPAPAKSMVDKQASTAGRTPSYVPPKDSKPATKDSKPATKDNGMGRIVQGTWQADPKGKVPAPSGDPEGVPESGAPMTAKQKSFAKLAPPKDKITFADKIAGAKKEVDEMLGDVAAEAMRAALGKGKQTVQGMAEDQPTRFEVHYKDNQKGRTAKTTVKGSDAKQAKAAWNDWNSSNTPGRFTFVAVKPVATEMDEEKSKGTAFDLSTPREVKPKVGSVERGHKHDIKHTATGRMVTRRTDDQGHSVGADDDSEASGEKRGRGRPKGTKQSIGAKGPSGKSKLMTKESDVDVTDQGEYDQEGDMAKDDIKTIVRHAQALEKILGDNDNLPEWVQAKLAKIEGMMISIDEYMQNQASDDGEEEPIAEKAVSKKQQRFMGMVHAAQKGEKPASKAVGKVAKTMKKKDAEDFASTKHKGLPEKKKKEVDENSEEGRLITKQTGPGQTSTSSTTGRISATMDKGQVNVKPAKSGGVSFGKGIYDSMNRELELMIAESMSVNMSDSTEGNKSLTVTATDDDAMKLAMILKSAGLGGGEAHSHGEEACDTCGMTDCGCGDVQEAVDENAPDWPTNTEQADSNFGYAGGLNKPKADIAGDGQSTVPVVATRPHNDDDLRRMMEMAGLAEAAKPDHIDLDDDGNKEESMKDAADDKEEDTVKESIRRMREMAGIQEAKKDVDEEKTEEGNLFTKGLEDDNVKIGDKIPGTNAIKKKDIDESIFALTNQWRAYKG